MMRWPAKGISLPHDALLPHDTRRALPIALLQGSRGCHGTRPPCPSRARPDRAAVARVRALGEESPLDAGEVSRRACVMGPSLTRIIKALQKRTLISHGADAGDGRKVMLAIAPAGEALSGR